MEFPISSQCSGEIPEFPFCCSIPPAHRPALPPATCPVPARRPCPPSHPPLPRSADGALVGAEHERGSDVVAESPDLLVAEHQLEGPSM